MGKNTISDCVYDLINRFETRNPFDLAKQLGASVVWKDIGSLKGMYVVINRVRYIVLNSSLDEYTARVVCAHELGHDQLHRAYAQSKLLQEYQLYYMRNKNEYEANVFAADLLLSSETIDEYGRAGMDIYQIAQETCTDINLVAIKMGVMHEQGYKVCLPDYSSSFLR